ncbi:hypothetical protein [Rhabdothermincola salaria]|uniref:hypothetical protein n=1 Tax=Rhabdothermincola salaria TaxID=2903142 RepID=UPI001E4113B2|nr:hypothetical protein [Rhabdothermincola salaria]MCD9623766.1 hypothetical protein [Rhabdothermincola salaria]
MLSSDLAVVLLAVSWPAVVAAVVAVLAVLLWGMLRRGSIADRARHDYPADDD